ncbi:MT-A70 family protein [Oxytricha trifallax]|uniref:mRNA m(6)A methyltransferase n=1 Tax=Oxytricha trifallax TaxID=1172189 RepID=A0A073HYB8_9SPIT|nr:MT-A70 family protein [Oxytricha trifallax]
MKKLGYTQVFIPIQQLLFRYVDEFIWTKTTLDGQVRSGNGHATRHAFEKAFIFGIGNYKIRKDGYKVPNVVAAPIRNASQKPDEQYALAESLCPGGFMIEIFARNHNLRDGIVSVGNQI